MNLETIVKLYRFLNKPSYDAEERCFCYEGSYNKKLYSKLIELDFDSELIQETDFEIDGEFFPSPDDFPQPKRGNSIKFTIKLAFDGLKAFYFDWSAFIATANYELVKFNYPEEFYIVEDDYYSKEKITNSTDKKLKNLVEFVRCLSLQAEYIDDSSDEFLRLVYFYKSDEGSAEKLLLSIDFKNPSLLVDELDYAEFSVLSNKESDDLLLNEKKNIFLATLSDFLKPISEVDRFSILVTELKKLKELFSNNLKAYFYKFSFQKIRQEVANAEIDFSAKCSKTLSDIQAKLLGIPVSLAGVVVLTKASSGFEIILLAMGLLFTSLILYSTVKVQLSNFNIIKSASKNVFNGFESRYRSYPETLTIMITEEWHKIKKQQRKTFIWLIGFLILSLVPATLSVLFVISKIWFSSITIIFIS